jgi:hypothetical protein
MRPIDIVQQREPTAKMSVGNDGRQDAQPCGRKAESRRASLTTVSEPEVVGLDTCSAGAVRQPLWLANQHALVIELNPTAIRKL